MTIETVSSARSFGGTQLVCKHASSETGTDMRFAVYLPPAAEVGPVPVVWFLAGLTCTEENFTTKAGAQRVASKYGIALVAPDTGVMRPVAAKHPAGSGDPILGESAVQWVDELERDLRYTKQTPTIVSLSPRTRSRRASQSHSAPGRRWTSSTVAAAGARCRDT